MPNKTPPSMTAAIPASLDAFHAIANIYLASAERLHALNFSAMREAVEDTATLTKNFLEMKTDSGFNKRQAAFAPPVLEKSAAYFRCAYEILTTAQKDAAQMLTSQLSGFDANLKVPAEWNKPFDLFAKSVQQFSQLAAKNTSPTKPMDSTALAETLMKVRKAA